MRFAIGDLIEYDLQDYPEGVGYVGLVCSVSVDYSQKLKIIWTKEDNSYLSYLFGINLNCKLWDKLTVNLDATITPRVDNPSEYIARGFGDVKLMVTKKLFINFNTILEYNSKVKLSDSTDTKFILGFGWDFL